MAMFGAHPETGRWDPEMASQQFKAHVQNIIAKHAAATPVIREAGTHWYERAHEEASKLGGGDVIRGAGIIAALSPQTGWQRNLALAGEMAKHGTATGTTGERAGKAFRIREGEDPRAVLGGHKVRSFFENIVDPESPEHVTIDRHAHDIALGRPFVGTGGRKEDDIPEDIGLGAAGRYRHFVHAYKHASGELDIAVPSRLQAITWSTHRGTAD